jgi:hypothetical protein
MKSGAGASRLRSGATEHARRDELSFAINELPVMNHIFRRQYATSFRYKPPAHRHSTGSTSTTPLEEGLSLEVMSALTGEHMFGPFRLQPHEKVSVLLRRLQHLAFTDNPDESSKRIQLTLNDRILDPSMSVLQSTADLDVALSRKLTLNMITEQVLLTWDQLVAMPAMRKRAGRGGKGACDIQRRLRLYCFENKIREVDLSKSDYDWPLLLKTMPSLNTQTVIGPGVIGFMFRLLDNIDLNYAPGGVAHRNFTVHGGDTGERHAFEISCANGDLWHVHFHQKGSCDLEHLPYEGDRAI